MVSTKKLCGRKPNLFGLRPEYRMQFWNFTGLYTLVIVSTYANVLISEAHQRVHCKFGHIVERGIFHDWLSAANPQWKKIADDMERTSNKPRTNPDGDVSFVLPLFQLPVTWAPEG
jgi:hypothetical protein